MAGEGIDNDDKDDKEIDEKVGERDLTVMVTEEESAAFAVSPSRFLVLLTVKDGSSLLVGERRNW